MSDEMDEALDSVNITFLDGAMTLTWLDDGRRNTLMTVRGKDHDLAPRELRAIALAMLDLVDRIEQRGRWRVEDVQD